MVLVIFLNSRLALFWFILQATSLSKVTIKFKNCLKCYAIKTICQDVFVGASQGPFDNLLCGASYLKVFLLFWPIRCFMSVSMDNIHDCIWHKFSYWH